MRIYKNSEFIEPGKTIKIFRGTRDHRDEPPHVHEFIEIIYILKGRSKQYIDERCYTVKNGDMLFVNYGSTHAFESGDGEFTYVNICFSPEVMSDAMITEKNAFSLLSLTAFNEMCNETDGAQISFFGSERHEVEELLFAMLREAREKQTSWDRVLESYLNILITRMLRKIEMGMETREIGDMWSELSDYIDANLSGELSLGALAQKCFYHPSYVSRVFKEKFKMSLVEYVNRRRIDGAIKLLEDSALSIDEISERVGFSDRSNFYRAFSKYVKSTPSDYRSAVISKEEYHSKIRDKKQ
ncbi:MAG: helix-turn-helix domain-containing protein [Clostridia bacterium]|nr:helix-turn-helix domain-containing protein [Clostridia bacterium]